MSMNTLERFYRADIKKARQSGRRRRMLRKFHISLLRIEFKPEDMWIGAYWRKQETSLEVWVCLIPCLPVYMMFK